MQTTAQVARHPFHETIVEADCRDSNGGRRRLVKQSANWDYQWGQIVGRAWADNDFSQRLRADPGGVLKEYDLTPPAGVRLAVLEDRDRAPDDTDDVMHLMLPGKPSATELSEDELCSSGGRGRRPLWLRRLSWLPWLRGCGGCGAVRPVCGAFRSGVRSQESTPDP